MLTPGIVSSSRRALGAVLLGQNGTQTTSQTLNVTLSGGNVEVGEDILVAFVGNAAGGVLSSLTITDPSSPGTGGVTPNTYTPRGTRLSGSVIQVQVFQSRVVTRIPAGSVLTVSSTATISDIEVIVFKMTGLTSTSADQQGVNSATGALSVTVTATGATAQGSELAVVVVGFNQAANSLGTIPANWTQIGTTRTSGGASPRYAAVLVRNLTAVGTTSVAVPITVSGSIAGVLNTFKAA